MQCKRNESEAKTIDVSSDLQPIQKQKSTLYSHKNNKNVENRNINIHRCHEFHEDQYSERNSSESKNIGESMSINTTTPRSGVYEATATLNAELFKSHEKSEIARKLPSSTINSTTRQSHSEFENVRTLGLQSPLSQIGKIIKNNDDKITTTTVCDSEGFTAPPVVSLTISSKFQNNKFIKHQVEYNQKQSVGNCLTSSPSNSAIAEIISVLPCSSQSSFNNSKRKMVAVHEVKKKENLTPQLHQLESAESSVVAECGRQRFQNRNSNNNNNNSDVSSSANIMSFDPSEELSYGPGIVSKLRCRYLSLALRESTEKKQHCLENLRRATSLNNLIDRNVNDDDEDEDEPPQEKKNLQFGDIAEGVEACSKLEEPTAIVGGGILKHNLPFRQCEKQQTGLGKMSSTFKKNTFANSDCNAAKLQLSIVQQGIKDRKNIPTVGQNALTASENSKCVEPILRQGTRHLKRGNEVLKRARSVEALLCEKTPWNFGINRSSLQTAPICSGRGASVTIEDKIHNAHERLLLGTDALPPQRLTSIINDRERPPPDLVKETLKIFEKSTNRRGRAGQKGGQGGGGEVANKVASYKSIIKQQKPTVALVRPPPVNSNKKIMNISSKVGGGGKPKEDSAELLDVPIEFKTIANTIQENPNKMEICQQMPSATISPSPAINAQFNNYSQINRVLKETKSEMPISDVNSPVSDLAKKLEKLCIENEKTPLHSKHNSTPPPKAATDIVIVGAVSAGNLVLDRVEDSGKSTATSPRQELYIHGNSTDIRHSLNDNCSCSTGEPDKTEKGEKHDKSRSNNSRAASDDLIVAADISIQLNEHDSGAQAAEICTVDSNAPIYSDRSDDDDDDDDKSDLILKTSQCATPLKFDTENKNKGTTLLSNKRTFKDTYAVGILNSTPNPPSESSSSTLNVCATTATTSGKQIGVIRPLFTNPQRNNELLQSQQHIKTFKQQHQTTSLHLTSLEIEKNRINEMKKSIANFSPIAKIVGSGGEVGSVSDTFSETMSRKSSFDTVINTNSKNFLNQLSSTSTSSLVESSSVVASVSGLKEVDSTTNHPLFPLRRKRQTPPAPASENTTMVFNFRDREKVPDYIENDGVIFRRKRVLPKPNESGFVRLPEISLETSTDPDYDDISMAPPSPCDIQFENANIVIDGKSSIRHKPKEAAFHVQFNDTLTSTFEYPSEASLILDDYHDDVCFSATNEASAHENLLSEHTVSDSGSSAHCHHHVEVDEIIPLPTKPSSANSTIPSKNVMRNLPFGSAPLGSYAPTKASIDNTFQLGVTRAPTGSVNKKVSSSPNDAEGVENDGDDHDNPHFKESGNENVTVAYSESAEKTDLLY